MIGPALRHTALLFGSLGATPLAFAQEGEPHDLRFVLPIVALAFVFVLGILAVALLHERQQNRERLAAIERLVTAGHTVPRELITGERPPLPLPQERRRDIRRGVTLLSWAIAVMLIPVIGSGGEWRYGIWGLLFLLPSLGSFFKAWLTAREIARGASNGSPQP
jgi:hypothetical protein